MSLATVSLTRRALEFKASKRKILAPKPTYKAPCALNAFLLGTLILLSGCQLVSAVSSLDRFKPFLVFLPLLVVSKS
jgi:hypothetical protein